MAYTMTLEEHVQSKPTKALIDFDYDFFDVNEKVRTEKLFYLNYWHRELCCLPPSDWERLFKSRWLLNVNEYNSKLETTFLKFDPFLTESLKTSTDTGTQLGQKTHYSSTLEQQKKDREQYQGQHFIIQEGVLDTDTTGHEDDVNHTVGNETQKTLQSEQGTKDVEEVTAQTTVTSDDTSTVSTKNTVSTEDVTGNKKVDGQSDRVNDTTTNVQASGVTNRYDYPQYMVENNPPNQGAWITWKETTSGTTDTTAHTDETITTNENTDTTQHTDGEVDESQNINVERDINEKLDKKVDTKQETTDELQKNVTTDNTKDYDGTIDTVGTVHTETTDTDKLKESHGSNFWTRNNSDLLTAETRDRNIVVHGFELIKGHSGKSTSALLEEFRATIHNYEDEFIKSFEILFWGLW